MTSPQIQPATSSNTQANKDGRTLVSPEIESYVSIKHDTLKLLNESDKAALDTLLEKDDRFKDIYAVQKIGKESLRPSDVILPKDIANEFSAKGQEALKTIIAAYGAYLSPFPTVEETEPFTSLLEYMTSKEHNWDMVVTFDKKGYINAGYCGRQLPVEYNGETLRAAWIEHTWAHNDVRNQGLGTKMYELFEANCDKDTKPQVVFIEIDNPRALNSDEKFHDMKNPEERTKLWLEDGQTMDPYFRNNFWGKQGFRIIALKQKDGANAAAPYIQISMDPSNMEEGGFCDTMFAGIKIRDPKFITGIDTKGNPTIDPELYKVLYPAIQGTIDPNLKMYPEFDRTMQEVSKVQNLVLLDPRLEEGRKALAKLAESLDPLESAKKDIAYCEGLLKGKLSSEDRELVGHNLQRAKLALAENGGTAEQTLGNSASLKSEQISLKELMGKDPEQALRILSAYHARASDPNVSGIPNEQLDPLNAQFRYLNKPRAVGPHATTGSFDVTVSVVKDNSPLGFSVTGAIGSVEIGSQTHGEKIAKLVEQAWGDNRDQLIADFILTAKQNGFKFVIFEGSPQRLEDLTKNMDPSSYYSSPYEIIQPSMVEGSPESFVRGLKRAYIPLVDDAKIPLITELRYTADWAEKGMENPAIVMMSAPLRSVLNIPLFPNTREGQAALKSFTRKWEDFLAQSQKIDGQKLNAYGS